MSDKILINRYASRRLYNTQTSEYVTLEEVAVLIRAGHEVEIKDRKTGEDLTRQYLLQIITEQESRGESVLPENVLADLVRACASPAQSFMPDFLAQSLDALKEQQASMMEKMTTLPEGFDPLAAFGSPAEWQKKQTEMMGSFMNAWMPKPAAKAEPAPSKEDDIADVKAQLAALQEKLKDL